MPSLSESAKMASYKLSQAADEDFENIFNYGIDTFGLEQAVVYQTGMKMRFDEMAENPMLYNAVDHIKRGYIGAACSPHIRFITPSKTTALRLSGFWVGRTLTKH